MAEDRPPARERRQPRQAGGQRGVAPSMASASTTVTAQAETTL